MKVFQYIPELDAFIPDKKFKMVVEALWLAEWNPVVFIGRYFCMDNDFGEHWFDNWDERDAIEEKAAALGYDSHDLLIINPNRFRDEADGPCHSDELRKMFWTEVLKSLDMSFEFLLKEAKDSYHITQDVWMRAHQPSALTHDEMFLSLTENALFIFNNFDILEPYFDKMDKDYYEKKDGNLCMYCNNRLTEKFPFCGFTLCEGCFREVKGFLARYGS